MPKLTFDEVLQAANEERHIHKEDIAAPVLRRKFWVSMNGLPGCMPNSRGVHTTKQDAIDSCVFIIGDDIRPGFKTELRLYHSARVGGEVYEIAQMTGAQLF